MKIIFFAVVVAMTSTAVQAQVCTLSDSDIAALASSPSMLTPKGFSALAPADQKLVCKTRADLRIIDAQNGIMNNPDQSDYRPQYLSPAENHRMVLATNAYFKLLLDNLGNKH